MRHFDFSIEHHTNWDVLLPGDSFRFNPSGSRTALHLWHSNGVVKFECNAVYFIVSRRESNNSFDYSYFTILAPGPILMPEVLLVTA